MNRGFWLIAIVIWALLLVALSKRPDYAPTIGLNNNKKQYSAQFLFISILPLMIWAGFRQGRGYVDTNAYIAMYRNMPRNIESFRYYIQVINTEDKGFSVYLFIIKKLFGESYRPFILLTAVFQCLSVAHFFRQYSWDYPLTFCLFIISTEYFGWIFNGLRQFMAVCIALYAVPFFLERKYIKSSLIVLLASTFHASAIILFPIAIAVNGKPWNKKTLITLGIGIGAVVASGLFTNVVEDVVANTQYADAVETWKAEKDNGANPFRVAVYLIPTVIAFLGRNKLEHMNDRVVDVSINMSIVTSALWIIAMATSGIYMGRLPIYTLLFNYILIPTELTVLFRPNIRKIVTSSMIIMYLAFYYYQFHSAFGVI